MRRIVRVSRVSAPTEHAEQCALFEWAATLAGRLPELRLLYAVPNGGFRHTTTAGRLKAEGVRAGVPDVCLPVARGGYHGLYVELKRRRGSTASSEQRQWLDNLAAEGYATRVCKGWNEAAQTIEAYLLGRLGMEVMP